MLGFLILFFGIGINSVQAFNLVSFSTISVASLLMILEASAVGAGAKGDIYPSGRRREGHVIWFVGGILLFIVAFPMWMKRRSLYGLKNMFVQGIIATILFSVCWFLMNGAIEESQSSDLENFYREYKQAIDEDTRRFNIDDELYR